MKEKYGLLEAARNSALGLSFTLLMLAAPVYAQNDNAPSQDNRSTTTTRTETARDDRRANNDRDWGWLGLLGLAGLLGLMPRKRVPVVHETRDVRDRPPVADRR